MSIRLIAKAQGIPEDYLRQLLVTLKKAQLVESVRGKSGGYSLARHPSMITVREILESIEGEFNLVVNKPAERALALYWDKSNNEIEKIFDISLEELILQKQKLDKQINYNI